MEEFTQQVTCKKLFIDKIETAIGLITWTQEEPEMYASIAAKLDGTIEIQIGGISVNTKYPEVGKWVVFDGFNFHVLTQEEFDAKGYQS